MSIRQKRSTVRHEAVLYYDGCCHRASIASVLRHYGIGEPASIIGASARSHARIVSGRLHFGMEYLEQPMELCNQHGFCCASYDYREPAAWKEVQDLLKCDIPVLLMLDSYYLPYFWTEYRRAHNLHVVMIWEIDRTRGRVLVADPSDHNRYVGELACERILAADKARVHRPQWLTIRRRTPWQSPIANKGCHGLFVRLEREASKLIVDTSDLSVAGVAEYIRARLKYYLCLADSLRDRNSEGWREAHSLRKGMRWTSNSLRWFGKYAQYLGELVADPRLNELAEKLFAISEMFMRVRGVYVRYGFTESVKRRETLADHIDRTLEKLDSYARMSGEEISSFAQKWLLAHGR